MHVQVHVHVHVNALACMHTCVESWLFVEKKCSEWVRQNPATSVFCIEVDCQTQVVFFKKGSEISSKLHHMADGLKTKTTCLCRVRRPDSTPHGHLLVPRIVP